MISGRAAIAGIGEIPPRRDTADATTTELLSRVADLTLRDTGLSLQDVDGLVVHRLRDMREGAVVLVEMLGLEASFVDRVDHGGATGAAMFARAAMAVATGMCTTCLCLAAFKVPARVEFRDHLPHNATGKVLKHLLEADSGQFVEE